MSRAPEHAHSPAVAASYGKLPLSFEPNAGRLDPDVRFVARGAGYALSLNRRDAVLSVGNRTIRSSLVRAARNPKVVGGDVQPGRLNSYVGHDPRRWVSGAHLYGKVVYRDVYPGVDLVYHGRQGALEYDFVVAPGRSPDRIALRFGGAVPRLDRGGNLRLGAALQRRPVSYQVIDGVRHPVRAAFRLAHGRVSFRLGAYDRRHELVIDPVLAYSTYLGGGFDDSARGIAVDSSKSAYVTGTVNGTLAGDTIGQKYVNDSNHPEYADAFVAKLSPDGQSLAYVTYFGGGQADTPYGIALNSSNEAFVAGVTQSIDFPTTTGAYQEGLSAGSDAYVVKLSSTGARSWATYLGGSHGNDGANAIAADANGVYVTGSTSSDNFPTTAGVTQPAISTLGNDAFATSLKTDGSGLNWSTFLGGDDLEQGDGIALDGSGNPVVAGTSLYSGSTFPHSSNFPLTPAPTWGGRSTFGGASEMFLASFNKTTGARTSSTFVGGSGSDTAHGLAIDDSGTDWVVGTTGSNDVMGSGFTGNHGGGSDAVVVPVSPSAGTSDVVYLGSSSADEGYAIARDSNAYGVYVTGLIGGSDMTEVNPLLPASARNGRAFIAKLDANALHSPVYLSYLGGASGSPFPNFGTGVAVDKPDGGQNRFAAYFLGTTSSTSFPTKSPEQPMNAGGRDVYLTKVDLATPTVDSGPTGPVKSTSVTFGFSSTDSNMEFNCWLNDVGFPHSCTSQETFDNVPQGPHTFYVSAQDSALVQTAIAARDFIVDTVPPQAPELGDPADGVVTDTQPTFTWKTATDATTGVTKYRLRIDGADDQEINAGACQNGSCSARVSKALPTGAHNWAVTAVDAAGNAATATARAFVAQAPPTAHFTIAPNPALAGRAVAFDGSGSADTSHTIVDYQWDLDGDGSFETDTGATATTSRTYTAAGNVPVSLHVTDSTGLTSTETNNLLVTTTPGTGGQFGVSINKGAQYTNNPNVVVTAVYPGSTTSLLFSNDGGFFAPTQFAPQREIDWRLDSSGPERLPKIVYVRFLAGPIVSETHTDDIILDETPPKVQQASVTPTAGAAAAARISAQHRYLLKVKATDLNSGVNKLQVTANKRKPGRLIVYKRKLTWKSATRPRWVRARDRAGNFSRWRKVKSA